MALAVAVKLRAANSKAIYYAHRPYHKATDHDEDAPALAGGAAPDLPRLATAQDPAERPCGASTALKRRAASEEFHPLRGGGGGEGARNGKCFGGLDHP